MAHMGRSCKGNGRRQWDAGFRVHSRKLTWKPKKGPIKTTAPSKGGYMGFHVSLGECSAVGLKAQDFGVWGRCDCRGP